MHGHPDDAVDQRQVLGGQAPRLVAEHPGDRPREAAGPPGRRGVQQVVEVEVALAVGGQHGQPGHAQGVDRLGQRDAGHHRQVEQAAGARADALGVVDVDAGVGQDDGLGARGVGGPQHRPGVAGIADPGQDGDQPRPSRQGRCRRDVDQPADGEQALRGDRLRHRCQHLVGDRARHQARAPGGVEDLRVPVGGVRRGVELADDAAGVLAVCGDRLADRLRPLGDEQAGPATRRAPGQAPHRPHPVGPGVGGDGAVRARRVAAQAVAQRAAQRAAQAGVVPAAGAGSAPRATCTSAVKAAASLTASSASIRRSTSTPAALSPWTKRL